VSRPLGRALSLSITLHALLAVAIAAILAVRAERVATQTPPPKLSLVYIARATTPQVGGGGGRAGESAPRPVEIPPHRQPVAVTVAPAELPTVEPLPTLAARVETNVATTLQTTGLSLSAPPGAGNLGRGNGLGGGKDDGAGPGSRGQTGGGPAIPGTDGVTFPEAIREVRPDYADDALRARVQGTVTLEVLVLANGTVGRVTVVKSLHPGLDQRAVAAARKWLFRPSLRNGQAVDVLVTMVLEFRLH
jgi:periplasmic protein TonB